MRHIEHRLNTLKHPKLILEAARNGTARYDPNRHLPALLGGSYRKSKNGQLDCLLDTEEIYNRLRKEKRAEYSPGAPHLLPHCYTARIWQLKKLLNHGLTP